jgi:hypothetical protein
MIGEIKDLQTALSNWETLNVQLADLKLREMSLRASIFKKVFPKPVEGINTHKLKNGYALKGSYPINRKVDLALLQTLSPRFVANKINAQSLVEYKASLKTGVYRTLTVEQRHLFDQCLEIKPGSPSLEIVEVKRGS